MDQPRILGISGVATLTERLDVAGVRDVAFAIKGTAANYTFQVSLDGVDFVTLTKAASSGVQAVALNTYTYVEIVDINAKYIRILGSVDISATVIQVLTKRGI